MITKNDIYKYLKNPDLVKDINCDDLIKLINIYPYFEALRWIYLRYLYVKDDATFDNELLNHGLFISNRRLFYEYMVFCPEDSNVTQNTELIGLAPINYFEVEKNPAQQQSLKKLAEKLKEARLAKQKENNSTKQNTEGVVKQSENVEEKVQFLIKEGKYSTALEILRSINLNNPKKSVYFALQIKYLETIINNNNKIN